MSGRTLITLLIVTSGLCPSHAGIHADFAVSQGGSPLGTFRARLDFDKAPRTCANFIGLASGRRPWIDEATGIVHEDSPFFDGLTFHRLIHSFVIQSGSPDGTGTDGPGYTIQDEFHGDLRHSGRYILSMAKGSLQDSGASQFFITFEARPDLDDKHSVFGEVVSGKEIIDGFTNAGDFPTEDLPSGQKDVPITPITIDSVTLGGDDLASFDIHDPLLELPEIRTIRYTNVVTDLPGDFFSVTFDRGFQTDYHSFESSDLVNWTPLARLFSIDQSDDFEFPLSELNPDRFFLQMSSIDYAPMQNPSISGSLQAGSTLTFTARDGSWVAIQLIVGGSTWSDSIGNSGNITQLSVSDPVGTTGIAVNGNERNAQLSHLRANIGFDSPAGVRGWTSLKGFSLFSTFSFSFHTPTSGWTHGVAIRSGGDPEAVYQAFSITPTAP